MTTNKEHLKKPLDENKINKKKYRSKIVKYAIQVLEKRNFKIVKSLGSGTYGDVILAVSPISNSNVAIKVIRSERTWVKELSDWPTFDHPNVMPLLDTIRLPFADIFIMPQMDLDLESKLNVIRHSSSGFTQVRSWLKDILSGLDYLHEQKLCHLDLKSDNVMIDFQNRAVLSDFTFLNSTMQPIRRYGAPIAILPPEACRTLGHFMPVDGSRFDMWCFGILAFNSFTDCVMVKQLKQMRGWKEDIYPILFDGMQANEFRALLTIEAFPYSCIRSNEVAKALNFLQFVLRVTPEDRPSASETLNHAFFDGPVVLGKTDEVWIKKEFSYSMLPSAPNSENDLEANSVRVKVADPSCDQPEAESSEKEPVVFISCQDYLSGDLSQHSHCNAEMFFTACDTFHPIESPVTDGTVVEDVILVKPPVNSPVGVDTSFWSDEFPLLETGDETTQLPLDNFPKVVTHSKSSNPYETFDDSNHENLGEEEEILEDQFLPKVIEFPRDSVQIKNKSRRKRVRQWFNRVWTRFRTCGSKTIDD